MKLKILLLPHLKLHSCSKFGSSKLKIDFFNFFRIKMLHKNGNTLNFLFRKIIRLTSIYLHIS